MNNVYKKGEIVFERIRPNQKLVIVQHSGENYYCVPQENPRRKALIFNARDLSIALNK